MRRTAHVLGLEKEQPEGWQWMRTRWLHNICSAVTKDKTRHKFRTDGEREGTIHELKFKEMETTSLYLVQTSVFKFNAAIDW